MHLKIIILLFLVFLNSPSFAQPGNPSKQTLPSKQSMPLLQLSPKSQEIPYKLQKTPNKGTNVNIRQFSPEMTPNSGATKLFGRKGFSINSLEKLLSTDANNLDQVQHKLAINADVTEKMLTKQAGALQAIRQRKMAIVDLDKLGGSLAIPPKILARGVEGYAIYDKNGQFVKLVFVPWNAQKKEFINNALKGLEKGWESIRIFFQKSGKVILSLEEKLDSALTRVKDWACSSELRPHEVSVSVNGQFDVAVVSFGGATGATYLTENLCNGN